MNPVPDFILDRFRELIQCDRLIQKFRGILSGKEFLLLGEKVGDGLLKE